MRNEFVETLYEKYLSFVENNIYILLTALNNLNDAIVEFSFNS